MVLAFLILAPPLDRRILVVAVAVVAVAGSCRLRFISRHTLRSAAAATAPRLLALSKESGASL